jgi:predicted GH43/DUF377 family glycosyl hydrolase
MPIRVQRLGFILSSDPRRVLIRPFLPGDKDRILRIVERLLSIPETSIVPMLQGILADFSQRHEHLDELFLGRFEEIRDSISLIASISPLRKLFIGAHFLNEYSFEAAALFNPSIIPHPDQSALSSNALRFILSLRATGEGHISSITFRTGVIDNRNDIKIDPPDRFVAGPRQNLNSLYEKRQYRRELSEIGLKGDFVNMIIDPLRETFTLEELRQSIKANLRESDKSPSTQREYEDCSQGMLLLALSNREVEFRPEQALSGRVIFPATPSQRNGIEDARFVCFTNEDGTQIYYATFTAYDGRVVVPQLMQTVDFLRFRFITLSGPAVENKGMALFPRKINDKYAMLSRQDNENIYLMFSEDIYYWSERRLLLSPEFSWEIVQIGNCGSPIETDAGWLVLSHGVGPMRRYCLGAILLDRDDPSKVIGRLREPILVPDQSEREGYVPNVVYTCGALIHEELLIIPYGMSDSAVGFATVPLGPI